MRALIATLLVAGVLATLGYWLVGGRDSATVSDSPAPEETVSEATLQAALEPHRQALEATRRPVVRIELEDFPQDEPQASKVGGSAWWPEGEAAPVGAEGEALVLLAQINFAEMPASPGYPGTGLLQFFISPDEYYGANFDSDFSAEALSVQRGFRVAYWPDLLVPGRVLPANADEEFMTPHLPDKPRRMRFVADDELLSSSDYRFDPLLGGNAYKTLEAWAKANGAGTSVIEAVYHHLDGSGHKFGGYPYFTQTDPRQGGPHELLLQLDTDEDMMWGDSGVGGFFIDPADLARGDFSRVMYTWDCH